MSDGKLQIAVTTATTTAIAAMPSSPTTTTMTVDLWRMQIKEVAPESN